MNAFQILATCGTALGLLLTVALSIAGWVISGQRAKITEITSLIGSLQKDIAKVHLTMVEEYVKDHDLQSTLERLDKTLDKMASSIESTGAQLQALGLTMARIEGASAASATKRSAG